MSGMAEVRDVFGRSYQIGPNDRSLLGYSRTWVTVAAWAVMLTVSATQYGYGVFAVRGPFGGHSPSWGSGAVASGFAVFIACQTAASGALPWLRRRYGLTSSAAVTAGAAGCAFGLLGLGLAGTVIGTLFVYVISAGLGAGLVYGTCLAVVAAWYPDRPVRTALVSGAFGYGAIPVILVMSAVGNPAPVFNVLAWLILMIAALWAPLLREPPKRWWPADTDPRSRVLSPALRLDPPAIREHSPGEVLRSGTAWVLAALALLGWAVGLFDTVGLASFGISEGWGLRGGALALTAFAAGCGGVRALAASAAARIGQRRVAAVAAYAGTAAQLALATAGVHRALALLVLASCGAGAAAGTWYALLPGLVRSFFGDQPGLPNLWLVYSAKAAGGVLGACGAWWLARAAGYPAALVASAALAMSAALLLPLLRRPGLPRTLPCPPSPAASKRWRNT
jgi:MFS family permease